MLRYLQLSAILLVVTIAILIPSLATAQIPGVEAPKADKVAPAPAAAPDPLGRDTPAGMVAGFLDALGQQNYDRAAEYFDLRNDITSSGSYLARQFRRVLDHGGNVFSRLRLSNNPLGDRNDGLKPEEEIFGSAKTETDTVDLVASRVVTDKGAMWLVSAQTIAQIPALAENVSASLLDEGLPQQLRRSRIWGAPVGHWLVMVTLIFVSYGIAWLLTSALWKMVLRSDTRLEVGGMKVPRFKRTLRALIFPVRILIAAWIFWIIPLLIGVSIVARARFSQLNEVAGLIAIAWILWRVIDAIADYFVERMTRRGRMSFLSAATFITRSAKFALAVITVIVALDAFGFNVTTGLAALGIGGLAIALGAQKTVENLVGSLTVLADQPVRVGDFCKFGDTLGSVEDIGMRSTRVRTNDRTVVTIPNGQFSSLQIENYSRRDKFWFHPTINLRHETTYRQMNTVLAGIRQMLREHPKVDPDPARVNFTALGENSLRLEIFAFIQTTDANEFMNIQEEMFLKIMQLAESAGTGFAFPSPAVYISKDAPLDPGKPMDERP